MEFRFEDILKKIIPGFIVFTGILIIILNQITFDCMVEILKSDLKEYSEVLLLAILIVSYLFGYLNDSISSIIENNILYGWFLRKPSYHILTNSCRKKLSEANLKLVLKKIEDKLKIKIGASTETEKEINKKTTEIFKQINEAKKDDSLLKEYYFSYIFSRNIFFAFIFFSIAILTSNHLNLGWRSYIIILLVLIILWIRRVERSFYYSRKVILGLLQME